MFRFSIIFFGVTQRASKSAGVFFFAPFAGVAVEGSLLRGSTLTFVAVAYSLRSSVPVREAHRFVHHHRVPRPRYSSPSAARLSDDHRCELRRHRPHDDALALAAGVRVSGHHRARTGAGRRRRRPRVRTEVRGCATINFAP